MDREYRSLTLTDELQEREREKGKKGIREKNPKGN